MRILIIEDAIDDIGKTILGDYPQILSLYLKISKPNIISNGSVALSKEWKWLPFNSQK